MSDTTRLLIDAAVPEGYCCICRRELDLEEARLVIGTTPTEEGEVLISATICRPCLSEHVPEMLAAVEAENRKEES